MIFIRTDANEEIATGHVMRCITIAKKIKELGEEVKFLFSDKSSIEVLNGREEYLMLEKKDNIYQEIPQILEWTKQYDCKKIFLDLYMFDAVYMRMLKEKTDVKLISFDDMFVEKYPVDILINYDFWYTKFDYRGRYEAETVKLLLGGDYVPLRDEFLQVGERKLSQKVETIMLTCGGGDKLHMLVAMLERFCSANLQNKYKIIVVTGLLNTDLSKIAAYEKKYQNIQLFVNVNNMAEIMRKADVVISAASTILYECCALQLPTIFFYVADNQQDAQGFEREGIMICAGDAQKDKNEVVENIVKNIELIREDVSMLNSMKEKMSRMIDGKGAWRIAKAICDL